MISSTRSIHCSHDRQGQTDLVSNLTVLSGVDLTQNFGDFIKPGRFPHSSLPAFIHELTHHWCFQTPVGYALAALRLGARRQALLTSSKNKNTSGNDYALVDNVIKYETALGLLRPLSEGLALFAEFDVVPAPHLQSLSTPMHSTYLNFTSPDDREIKDAFGLSLFDLLWSMRSHELYVQRKSNVLLEPASATSSAYLSGYLTVKNYWRQLSNDFDVFNDSDIFFSFIKTFIFDDYGLVFQLLRKDLHEIDAGNKVSTYIQNRLNILATKPLSSIGKLFLEEMALSKPGFVGKILNGPILVDQKTYKSGQKALDEAARELDRPPRHPNDLEWQLRAQDKRRMSQRRLMCLGRLEVTVRAAKADWFVVEGANGPMAAMAPQFDIPPKDGSATLEVYLSHAEQYTAAVISQMGKPLAVIVPTSVYLSSSQVRSQLKDFVFDRNTLMKIDELAESAFSSFAMDKVVPEVFESHILQELGRVVDGVYMSKAVINARRSDLDKIKLLVLKDGLLHFLRNSEELRDISALSLAASMTNDISKISEIMKGNGTSSVQAISVCERIFSEFGWQLIFKKDNQLACLF